jgi:hypothetical protein
MEREPNKQGKKIFFLYPHHFIKDLIIDIIKNEYEAYLLYDHVKTLKLLRTYSNSILYINLDEVLKEPEWENYIRTLKAAPEFEQVKIGVMTHFHTAQNFREKYLRDLKVECGFIVIGTNMSKCSEQILQTLATSEARGCRKYVRAFCNPSLDTFNIILYDSKQEGSILDMSIAGMAVTFNDKNFNLGNNSRVNNIQIKLRGAICTVCGVVGCKRKADNGETVYIIMFDQKWMTAEVRGKIHTFICHCLQESLNHYLDGMENTANKQKPEQKNKEETKQAEAKTKP